IFSIYSSLFLCLFFFYTDASTSHIYTLSLHDALPIFISAVNSTAHLEEKHGKTIPLGNSTEGALLQWLREAGIEYGDVRLQHPRSEEHTSELQSRGHLVCRLLLEKKKTQYIFTVSSEV